MKYILKSKAEPIDWLNANKKGLYKYVHEHLNKTIFNNAIEECVLQKIIHNDYDYNAAKRIQNGLVQLINLNAPLALVFCTMFHYNLDNRYSESVMNLERAGLINSLEELNPFIKWINVYEFQIVLCLLAFPLIALMIAKYCDKN